jgi:peptide/nickel transport system substrate-binding protein
MIARARAVANCMTTCLLLLTGIAGCAGSPRSPDTIVIASGTDLEGMQPLTTVHPLSRQVQRYLVFTPLIRLTAALVPEPWAAESWTWNASRTVLRFRMDSTLRWHDGAAVSSADGEFTVRRAQDRATGFPRRGDLDAIDSVTAAGAHELVVYFARPQSDVPLVFAELPLVPAHLLRDVAPRALRQHPFTFAPVGSGPYRVVSREAGRRWILERIPSFPARLGGAAATTTLVIAVIDEATTKVAGLVSGALDIAGVNPATAGIVRRDPTLRVLDYPTFFTNWLVFNPACAAVQDVRVRRAIALSLDRRRIVDAGIGGFGAPSAAYAANLARDTTPAHPQRADSLLDAAGWVRTGDGVRQRGGQSLSVPMLTVGSGDNPVEQLMQADLRARGIALSINSRDMGALLSSARTRAPGHCLVYTGVAGDPGRSQLPALFDPAAAGGALEFGAQRPQSLSSLFAVVRTTTDSVARDAAWRAVYATLDDSVPATPVFHSRGVQGLSRRLQHVTIDLRGELYSAARWTLSPVTP